MNGRAYVQNNNKDRKGWIMESDSYRLPITYPQCLLTDDVEKSLVFDVDSGDGFNLLNSFIENGYIVVIASNIINRKPVMPSASPFSPVI